MVGKIVCRKSLESSSVAGPVFLCCSFASSCSDAEGFHALLLGEDRPVPLCHCEFPVLHMVLCNFESLSLRHCINLRRKMLPSGFVSEETALLMNPCLSAQRHNASLTGIGAGWSCPGCDHG